MTACLTNLTNVIMGNFRKNKKRIKIFSNLSVYTFRMVNINVNLAFKKVFNFIELISNQHQKGN